MPTSTPPVTAPSGSAATSAVPSTQAAGASAPASSAADDRQRERSIKTIGWALFGLFLALAASLFVLSGAAAPKTGFTLLWLGWHVNHAQVLILGVMIAGAMGGCIHVATSFSDYVGNATYKQSWQWWYVLRPFIGASLALAFYFLIRGGLLSLTVGTDQTQDPSFYAMVAISFMVGMFSKQATDKLDDVFDTLFKTNKDNERKDGNEPKVPELKAIEPASVPVGSPDQQVVLTGANLTGVQLKVDGVARAVDSVTDDRIAVTFKAAELTAETTYKLTVENAAGAAATTLEFKVVERREAEGGTPDDRGDGDGEATTDVTGGSAVIDTSTVTSLGATGAGVSGASDTATPSPSEGDTGAGDDNPAP